MIYWLKFIESDTLIISISTKCDLMENIIYNFNLYFISFYFLKYKNKYSFYSQTIIIIRVLGKLFWLQMEFNQIHKFPFFMYVAHSFRLSIKLTCIFKLQKLFNFPLSTSGYIFINIYFEILDWNGLTHRSIWHYC